MTTLTPNQQKELLENFFHDTPTYARLNLSRMNGEPYKGVCTVELSDDEIIFKTIDGEMIETVKRDSKLSIDKQKANKLKLVFWVAPLNKYIVTL